MMTRRHKSGEAIALILFAVFGAAVIGTIIAKTRHDGLTLYPERCYPYQGPLVIQTNNVPAPKW